MHKATVPPIVNDRIFHNLLLVQPYRKNKTDEQPNQ